MNSEKPNSQQGKFTTIAISLLALVLVALFGTYFTANKKDAANSTQSSSVTDGFSLSLGQKGAELNAKGAMVDVVSCFAVSDSGINQSGSSQDALFSFDVPDVAGTSVELGDTGTNYVEAIEYVTHRDKLYFGNGTEIWVSEGPNYASPSSCGDVPGVTDIDGMTYDPINDLFYISDRNGTGYPSQSGAGGAGAPDDELLTLSIDDACNVAIIAGPVDIATSIVNGLADIDDIAVDPFTGQLYGIANNSNESDTYLVEINPSTGAVISSIQLNLSYPSNDDVEGLTFSAFGDLLMITGESAGITSNGEGPNSSEVYILNPVTGTGVLQGDVNDGASSNRSDMESITCGQPVMKIGDTVWNDLDNSGTINGSEAGINGVKVELFQDTDGDGVAETLLDSTITATVGGTAGMYMFGDLRPGDYKVAIPASEFAAGGSLEGFSSSTGNGAGVDPDNNTDNDDNGDPDANGGICTEMISLVLGQEPADNPEAPGPNSYNPTVDLGVVELLSLGDTVFCDENGNSIFDAGDIAVDGVVVNLYEDTTGNGIGDTFVKSTTTSGGGLYSFTDLTSGDYLVEIPASEFGTGEPLEGKASSPGGPDPDNNIDNDDNGAPDGNGAVITLPITLSPGGETGDGDSDPDNNQSVDLGFVNELSLGDIVFCDENGNSTFDSGDIPVNGVVVNLYEDSNDDGLAQPGEFVATTTTAGGGLYSFGGLSQGDYIVVIPASEFAAGEPLAGKASSPGSPDPDNNVNNDDNSGDLDPSAAVPGSATAPITLTPAGESGDGDADDNNNPSVDLGYINSMSLGNVIWCEAVNDRNNVYTPGVDDVVVGLTVELWIDTIGDLIADTKIDDDVTDNGGQYLFEGLSPGTYFVVIPPGQTQLAPKSQVASSATPNDNINNDSNALPGGPLGPSSYVSGPIVMTSGGEPSDDGDSDLNSNLSIDMGFDDPSLDVELSAFDVEIVNSTANLTWTTASEENNVGFGIEMSTNNGAYEEFGFVQGNGTTSTESNYSYSIDNLSPGTYNFRLKQVDTDGSIAYSQVLAATNDLPGDYILENAYPNPFNPTTSIKFTVKERQEVSMNLYDASGRMVKSLYSGSPEAGVAQQVSIDASNLPSGTYLVRLTGVDFTATQSITLIK